MAPEHVLERMDYPCPWPKDHPRWWPHTPAEHAEQRARLKTLLEQLGINLGAPRGLLVATTPAGDAARREHHRLIMLDRQLRDEDAATPPPGSGDAWEPPTTSPRG